jgi:anaerobic selenocysteine-containing dehydrogenase
VYGFDDRLRGLTGDRRVVLLHPDDIAAAGLSAGQAVDLTSHFRGQTRTLRGFRVVRYDLPRRCAAAYFPEANGLVPLESQAERSHTPSYKSIEISITSAGNLA